MTDPRALWTRYLEQRQRLGEDAFVLEHPLVIKSVPSAVAPAAKRADRESSRPRSERTAGGSGPKDAKEKWRKDAPDIPAAGIQIPTPETNFFVSDPLAEYDLDQLADAVRRCEQCALCKERTHAVPGEGPPNARLMVIGEGPGANEDQQGRPFVGRAGDLLNDILAAIDCPRETVYIANVVKCRPPGNRNPERDEIAECLPYLHRQIALVKPDVIIALGAVAAGTLLNTKTPLGALRNQVHDFRGIPLVVTYHPAALLRNPNWKKPTWDDVRIARRLLAGER